MEWSGIEQNVLLGAAFTLAIAVLGMLAKTSNNLSATSDALKSHVELNRKLNDELAAAYEERSCSELTNRNWKRGWRRSRRHTPS